MKQQISGSNVSVHMSKLVSEVLPVHWLELIALLLAALLLWIAVCVLLSIQRIRRERTVLTEKAIGEFPK